MFLFNVLQLLFDIFQFRTFQTKMFESNQDFERGHRQVKFISSVLCQLSVSNLSFVSQVHGQFANSSLVNGYMKLIKVEN